MSWKFSLCILAMAAATGLAGAARGDEGSVPMTYVLDAKRSALLVRTYKAGPAARLAHDHAIRARSLRGSFTVNAADPAKTVLDVVADVRALEVDAPATRRLLGFTDDVPDSDREKVTSTMLSAEQLDVERFPTVQLKSVAVHVDKSTAGNAADFRAYTLDADLTIHGVTQRVKVPVQARLKDGVLEGSGKLTVAPSAYGVKPYEAMFGAIRNEDRVDISLALIAVPAAH